LADDQRTKRGASAVASPSRRAPRLPAHPGHPRTPHRVTLFKAAAEPPAELPTLAAPGATPLTNHAVPPKEKEKEGRRRKGAARRRAVRREDRSRPREEPDPLGTTTSPTSSSSPPPRRRLLLLLHHPRRQAAPPLCTDACTSASGHRGENTRIFPPVDATAIELRRNARRSAPPRRRW
jgi:hypothetical protein